MIQNDRVNEMTVNVRDRCVQFVSSIMPPLAELSRLSLSAKALAQNAGDKAVHLVITGQGHLHAMN